MALKRVWTTRSLANKAAQDAANFLVGDVVGLSVGAHLHIKITHSVNQRYPVGSQQLWCGKRCRPVLMDDDVCRDEQTLDDVTPRLNT